MTIHSRFANFLLRPAVLAAASIFIVGAGASIYHVANADKDPAVPIVSPSDTEENLDVLEWQRDQLQIRAYIEQARLARYADNFHYLSTDPINSDYKNPFRGDIACRIELIRGYEARIRQIETKLARAGR